MRVLFVHNGRERFVLDDLYLLRQSHIVTDWHQPQRRYNPVRLLKLVLRHDVVFCWFASWHSLAPVLFAHMLRKPSIVVVGGYDIARVPQAGYGAERGGLPRFVTRTIVMYATRLLAFSNAARNEAISNSKARPCKISVAYPGVSSRSAGPINQREPIVLTVGGVWRENLLRKGLLPFVQAASHLPDVKFVLAGRWNNDGSIDVLRRAAGPNVEFTGFVSDEELQALYREASVYVQASLHEGFGLSVAEAMCAGCIPVATRAGSLPEVVGDCGIYSESNDPQAVAEAIRIALAAPDALRSAARRRVLDCFSMQRRKQQLEEVIGKVCS